MGKKNLIYLCCLSLIFVLSAANGAQAVVPPWEIEGLRAKEIPDFQIKDITGKTITNKELQGKVVLLNFWATWCRPCAQEMPAFERLYQRYKDKGLVIVGISVDSETDFVKNFLKKISVTFPIAVDTKSEVANAYKVFTYPTTFLVDRHGVVQDFYLGSREWEEEAFIGTLEKLLGPVRK